MYWRFQTILEPRVTGGVRDLHQHPALPPPPPDLPPEARPGGQVLVRPRRHCHSGPGQSRDLTQYWGRF